MFYKEPIDTIQLYTALHRLGRQMHRCAHRIVHEEGHYREQPRLLMLIAENDGVIQRDLAEEMDVRPSSMTEMLSKMEQLGLVERRQDEKDQRVMHIFLTEQGKNAVKKSQNAAERMANTLFAGLTDEEVKTMVELTEKLCTQLGAMDSAEMEQDASQRGHHRGFDYFRDYHGFGSHYHHGFDRF